MNFSRMSRASDFGDVTIREIPDEGAEALKKRLHDRRIHDIRVALRFGSEGPLTPFVLISRAARIASDRRAFNAEDVANALYEELTEIGWLIPNEDAGIVESDS